MAVAVIRGEGQFGWVYPFDMKTGERMLLVAGCAAGFGLFLSTLGMGIGILSILQPPVGEPRNQLNVVLPTIGLFVGSSVLVAVLRRQLLSVEAALTRAESSVQLEETRVWFAGLLCAAFMFLIIWSVSGWWAAVHRDPPRGVTGTVLFGSMGHVLGTGGFLWGCFGRILFSQWQGRHAGTLLFEDEVASV